jgi:uncharacterized lipoprotein YmbA
MRRIRLVFIALALVAASVAGCASPPPPITYYLLRGDPVEGQGPIDARVSIGIGRIVIAPYLLGSKGIMIETGPSEVRPASRHQWAEPLDSGLRWFLREEVASELGFEIGGGLTDVFDWNYRVDIFVARMHATMDGRAILESIFVLRSSEASDGSGEYRFTKSVPLPQEGYAGVVEAQRGLARELAGMIASALRERMEAADVAETETGAGH